MAFQTGRAYPQLHCDAARIYAVALKEDAGLLEKTKFHLAAAVTAGYSRYYFRHQQEFEPWKSEPWFVDAMANVRTGETSISQDFAMAQACLHRPTSIEVTDWLRSQALHYSR